MPERTSWAEISPERREDLLRRWQTEATTEQLAEEVGMWPPTLSRRLRELRRIKEHEAGTLEDTGKPGKSRAEPLRSPFDDFDFSVGKAWVLKGDWMVIGDVHVPFTDIDFADLVLKIAKKHNIRRLLIAGDLWSMDQFSHYDQIIQPPKWAQERDFARLLFQQWMEWFIEIKMIMGNHDRRLQKWTAGAFDTTDILNLVVSNPDIVQISNFGWCTIETSKGPWRITHPKNYSINQLTVADALASKFQANIISHHEHHVAHGWDRYKNFVIVNNGTLADHTQFAYAVLDDSKSAGMAKSFVRLQDGVAHLYGEYPFTNWEEVLGK